MTIYESVIKMDKGQFSKFCFSLYNKGWFDRAENLDDEDWVRFCMADYDVEECDCLDVRCD